VVVRSVLALSVVVLNDPTQAPATARVPIKNSCIAMPAEAGASKVVAAEGMGEVAVEEMVVMVEGKRQITTKIHKGAVSPMPVRMETVFKTTSLLSLQ